MTSATTLRDHYNEEEDYLFVWITSSVIIYQHISNAKAAHSRMCCSNGIINLFVDVFTLLFWTRIRAFHFIKTCRKLNVGNSVIYYINWYEHKILIRHFEEYHYKWYIYSLCEFICVFCYHYYPCLQCLDSLFPPIFHFA